MTRPTSNLVRLLSGAAVLTCTAIIAFGAGVTWGGPKPTPYEEGGSEIETRLAQYGLVCRSLKKGRFEDLNNAIRFLNPTYDYYDLEGGCRVAVHHTDILLGIQAKLDIETMKGYEWSVLSGSAHFSGNPNVIALLRDMYIESARASFGTESTLLMRSGYNETRPLLQWGDDAVLVCDKSSISIYFGEGAEIRDGVMPDDLDADAKSVYNRFEWIGGSPLESK